MLINNWVFHFIPYIVDSVPYQPYLVDVKRRVTFSTGLDSIALLNIMLSFLDFQYLWSLCKSQ